MFLPSSLPSFTARIILLSAILLFSGVAYGSTATKGQPVLIQQAVQSATRAKGLQTEMPTPKPQKAIQPENISPPPDLPRWKFSSNFAKILFWSAIGIILIIILVTLRDNLWSASRSRRIQRPANPDAIPAAVNARMDQARREAAELAGGGSYTEAIHILLLQSLDELRRRLDISIAASLTSREILQRIELAPEERTLFADIIGRVEITYFGEYAASEADYLACRQSYEALTQTLVQGRP